MAWENIINLDQIAKFKDLAIKKGKLIDKYKRFNYLSKSWIAHDTEFQRVSLELEELILEITSNKFI